MFFPNFLKCILLFTVVFFAFCSFGQEYGTISPEVRAKMDQNKLNGQPSYNGVLTAYSVVCEGLDNGDLQELKGRANNHLKIKELKINSLQSVEVICLGGTGFSEVKSIFSSLVDDISSISIDNRLE